MPNSFSSSKSTTTSYTSLLQFNPPPPPIPSIPFTPTILLSPQRKQLLFRAVVFLSSISHWISLPLLPKKLNLYRFQIFNCFYIVLTILPTIPLPCSDSGVVSRVTNTLIFLGDTSFGLLFRKFTKDAKLSIIF